MNLRSRLFSIQLLAVGLLTLSCTNNQTLETFDVGEKRSVRVTTGVVDNYLPIYYEMYEGNKLVQQCYIFSSSPEREEVAKMRFKMVPTNSNKVFVLMQEAPEAGPLAIFDFSSGFRYPCCADSNETACRTRFNQLADDLERDNPPLKIERLPVK